MNKHDAIQEVKNLGDSYYYDEFPDKTDDEILRMVENDVCNTAKTGLFYWEKTRDGLSVVLTECSQEELEDLLLNDYAHEPSKFDSRKFFGRVHQLIASAIDERKKQIQHVS